MASDDCDVLIVGAGPVGLALGIQCRRFGASVRVVEMRAEPSPHSRALALWSSALEALETMGCAAGILEAGSEVREIQISSEASVLAAMDVSHGVESRYPLPMLLPQSETERILTERLGELGVEVERGVQLASYAVMEDGVESVLRDSEGDALTVRSRWLAGCDGMHSTVRRGAGIDFIGETTEERFALGDVEIDQDLEIDVVQIDWSGAGALALFPVMPGTWRIVANRRGDEWGSGPATLEELEAHLAAHGRGDWKLSNPTWLSSFRVSERRAATFRKGPVMLLGDAAHVHSPAGGQGMNLGIQDAFNLGWKLGLLAAGRGDEEALLTSYDTERSMVAEMAIESAAERTKMSLVKNPILRATRNASVRVMANTEQFQEKFAAELSGLRVTYAESPVIDNDSAWAEDWRSDGFGPGERVRGVDVYCPRRKATIALLDEMAAGGHAIMLFSGRKPDAADVDALRWFEERVRALGGEGEKFVRVWRGSHAPEGAEWFLDAKAEAHLRYGVELPAAYVVRPDGFVAFRCSPLDAELMAGYAEVVLG